MIVNFRNKDISVKERLEFHEAGGFVRSVSSAVVSVEEGTYSPLLYNIGLISSFIAFYTDMEVPSYNEIYIYLTDYQEFISNIVNHQGKSDFDKLNYDKLCKYIDMEIDFYKQMAINNQKSSMDDAFDKLSTLLSTLNTKAEKLDTKKIYHFFKELNPNEIINTYQKSNFSNIRDKANQNLNKKAHKDNDISKKDK
jgi:hypothetical protein